MNLRTMVNALIDSGHTQKALAAAVGTSQPTINRLANGVGSTDFETGKKIQQLYEQLLERQPNA